MRLHLFGPAVAVLLATVLMIGSTQAQLAPRLPPLVSAPQAEMPVRLQAMAVQVDVAGEVANISYDMTFHNPNARVLEGFVEFPLAQGQQVVGFALDIDGVMRDAVAVPKDKGRAVFEAIERRGVDPGLLEQTAGQQYRLRVYPFPANGQRRVRIEVMQRLLVENGRVRLPLGLEFAQAAQSLTVQVNGVRGLEISGLRQPPRMQGSGARTRLVLDAAQRRSALALQWRARADDADQVTLQSHDGDVWALASLRLPAASAAPQPIPTLGLLWDASMSAGDGDASLLLASVQRLIAEGGVGEVKLIVLRDRAEAPQTFIIRDGDSSALRAALETLACDGASSPGGWVADAGVTRWLYVGDGLFNFGDPALPQLAAGQRLDALVDVRRPHDGSRLQQWTEANRGRLVQVQRAADVDAVPRTLLADAARIQRIEAIGAVDAVAESIWPGTDGRVHIAARTTTPDARLVVHWRDARGSRQQEIPLVGEATPGRLASRLWAQWTIRRLQTDPTEHRARLQELGQRFGIVNAQTSLIVLEDPLDYLRYAITPPPELRDAHAKALASWRVEQARTRQQRLDAVAALWDERERWWRTEWPKDAPPVATTTEIAAPHSRDMQRPMAAPAPPPTPAAAPAQMQAQAADSLDRIVVTGSRIANEAASEVAADAFTNGTAATIRIQPWQSDSPAAKRLREASDTQLYAWYLDERRENRNSPAFFLDAADVLAQRGQRELALRVLSNLAELQIEDRHLLRVLAYRLLQLDAADAAVPLLQRVRELAGDEPQSHRDLGLALAQAGQYQAAADALYRVVEGEWDARFRNVQVTALAELNALIAAHARAIDVQAFDPRLLRNLPVGLRTVLSWDADNSDMDLWVTDPDGERAYYGHRHTRQGGRLSEDFTGGYGPEEFVLRDPKPGLYKVEANYFGDRHQVLTGDTSLFLWLSTGFGTARQVDRRVGMRLAGRGDTVLVGEFEVK